MTNRVIRGLMILGAGAVTAACVAHPPPRPGPPGSSVSTTTTSTVTTPDPSLPQAMEGAAITGVRIDGTTATVTTTPLPPADGPEGCRAVVSSTSAYAGAEGLTLSVVLLVDRWDDLSGCPGAAPRTATVALAAPPDGGPVYTSRPVGPWLPVGDGTYRRCVRPACDPGPADPLPTFTCETRGPGHALDGMGPAHLAVVTERCQDRYGVVDFDFGIGACPVTDDYPNPCAGQRMSRVFTYAHADDWRIVRTYTGAGCGTIALDIPEFPLDLCQDLPAVEHAGDWGG
jgi:hypothetical protein